MIRTIWFIHGSIVQILKCRGNIFIKWKYSAMVVVAFVWMLNVIFEVDKKDAISIFKAQEN